MTEQGEVLVRGGLAGVSKARPRTDGLSGIAAGTGIGLAGFLLQKFLALAFQWTVARAIGPEDLGILSLGLSASGMAVLVVLLGQHQGVVRFVAHYRSRGELARAAGTILAALALVGLANAAALPVLWWAARLPAWRGELSLVLRVLMVSVPFAALTRIMMSVAQASRRLEYRFAVDQLAVPAFRLVSAVCVLHLLAGDVTDLGYAVVLSSAIGAILSIWVGWRLYPLRGVAGVRPMLPIRPLVGFCWPLLLTSLIDRTNAESEILLLGALSTPAEVGIYTVGLRATVFIAMFLEGINVIFAPVAAELFALDRPHELARLYRVTTRWAVMLSLPVFLVLFLQSAEVMSAFGAGFAWGAPVLQILAVSQLVFVGTGPSGWLLMMTGHPRMNLLNTSLTLGLTVVLDLLLIPRYGALGAAFAGATAVALVNLLRLGEVYWTLRSHPYDWGYFKPLAAALLSSVGATGLQGQLHGLPDIWRLVCFCATLCVVYIAVLLLSGLDGDTRHLLSVVRRRMCRGSEV